MPAAPNALANDPQTRLQNDDVMVRMAVPFTAVTAFRHGTAPPGPGKIARWGVIPNGWVEFLRVWCAFLRRAVHETLRLSKKPAATTSITHAPGPGTALPPSRYARFTGRSIRLPGTLNPPPGFA